MKRFVVGGAMALCLVSPSLAGAQPMPAAPASKVRTIRFPVYDPALGSLPAYRRALIAAVDRHVARLAAGPAVQVAGVEVAPRPSNRQASLFEVRGALAPGMNSKGAISGSVGTDMVDLRSASRTGH